MPETRVVVVGAGPAGAALAYLLARRGVDVTLMERHTDFAREFRGEGLMPSGVAALTEMGLETALAGVPQAPIAGVEFFRGPRPWFRVTPEQLGGAGPRIVSQPAMLEMLVAEAGRFPSFRLARGATVRDLVRDGERVAGVRMDSASGPRELRATLVVGTDGRASVVRARTGVRAERMPQAFDIVWAKIPLPTFLPPGSARAYVGVGHFLLAFPSYDGRLQVGWIIAKGSFGDLRRHGVDAWLAEMERHVSPDLAAHLAATRDRITSPFLLDVVCDRVERWSVPGVLLLGDAAHTMSPVGAQGINVALRDAIVAANHLVPALTSGGDAPAIDAAAAGIETERLPEIVQIQDLQQRPPRVLFGRTALVGLVLQVVAPLLLRTGIATRVAASVFQRFAYGVTPVRLRV
ncbi:MAG TPA: FAD-dependent oxidoreductase [Candidatus Binatia bacterium]|nr:FAD-dependent oxidoreductase [Candidatus Binatia bacterium]